MRQTSTTIAEKQIPTGALGYALRCAAAGRPVLPCKPRQKVPATPHGVHDATLDPATIAAWSRRKPGGNWGGACGNGVVVLDFDGPGADALAASLELPPAPRMDTARGFQLTFSYQGELPAALYDAQGAKQGDVKASGCCMLPGSVHPSGVLYVARDGWSPIGPPLPEHSADRIRQAHEAAHPKPAPPPVGDPLPPGEASELSAGILARKADELARTGEGGRQNAANASAFCLGRRAGDGALDDGAIVAALLDACRVNGLVAENGEAACRATILGGLAAGRAVPVRLTRRVSDPDAQRIIAAALAVAHDPDAMIALMGEAGGRGRWRTDGWVLGALAEEAARWGSCSLHPGVGRLAELTGFGRATVKRSLDRLPAVGALAIDEPGGAERRDSHGHLLGRKAASLRLLELVERVVPGGGSPGAAPTFHKCEKPYGPPPGVV